MLITTAVPIMVGGHILLGNEFSPHKISLSSGRRQGYVITFYIEQIRRRALLGFADTDLLASHHLANLTVWIIQIPGDN